jgi:CO/xanthine dehydrogenase FAD-binding subunit
MQIQDYVRPSSLEEAYSLLEERRALVIGGGAWTRMNTRSVELAVDLSGLDLRYIKKKGKRFEIGAMTTARDLETSEELKKSFGNIISEAVAHIVGVQLRNIITVGGTVFGRYGFSDLLTALLALDAAVVFHDGTESKLGEFITSRSNGPVLIEKIVIDADGRTGAYKAVRHSKTDFSILNTAAVRTGDGWRVAVGARPGSARLSEAAAQVLGDTGKADAETAARAGAAAAKELSFGDDQRSTGEYRQSVCSVLIKRAVEEVVQ